MNISKGGIAFFDSGIGGLTVLAECRKSLRSDFYYYGDNMRAPYGNLSPSQIKEYVSSAFDFFASLEAQAAVLACNTATAVCVESLRKKYSFPIVGAEPAILPAAKRGGEVFVLTTRATYESKRFLSLCKKVSLQYPNAIIRPYPCELLAGAIERHVYDPTFDYSLYLPKGRPKSVVLGCTHYIYIKKQIQDFYQCQSFDGNKGIAKRLCNLVQTCERGEDRLFSAERGAGMGKNFFFGSGENINRTQYEQMFT